MMDCRVRDLSSVETRLHILGRRNRVCQSEVLTVCVSVYDVALCTTSTENDY